MVKNFIEAAFYMKIYFTKPHRGASLVEQYKIPQASQRRQFGSSASLVEASLVYSLLKSIQKNQTDIYPHIPPQNHATFLNIPL